MPQKITKQVFGFDLQPDIDLLGTRLKPKNFWQKIKFSVQSFFKYLFLYPFAYFSLFYERLTDIDPITDDQNNLLNPFMNNVDKEDYCNKDWVWDNDAMISRASMEFPRNSKNKRKSFFSKDDKCNPWGP